MRSSAVLIESDWNLKTELTDFQCRADFVLIESDWNLKQAAQAIPVTAVAGINRIRLEFKGQKGVEESLHTWVLIESDWNLKVIAHIPF